MLETCETPIRLRRLMRGKIAGLATMHFSLRFHRLMRGKVAGLATMQLSLRLRRPMRGKVAGLAGMQLSSAAPPSDARQVSDLPIAIPNLLLGSPTRLRPASNNLIQIHRNGSSSSGPLLQ